MWPKECIGNTMCMYKGVSKFHVKLFILNAFFASKTNCVLLHSDSTL